MWYLIKRVTLTKDNLVKRRWKGNVRCCFFNLNESIQHLFFDCPNARFIWRLIHVSFGLPHPLNVAHLFNDWLHGVQRKIKYQALVGASAICWAIWLSRNDEVFNRTRLFSSLQVVFRGTHCIRFWALLQKEEDRPHINWGCCVL
jgi:hypothetical protein